MTKDRVTRLKKDGGALVQVLIIMINYSFSFYIHIYTNLTIYLLIIGLPEMRSYPKNDH